MRHFPVPHGVMLKIWFRRRNKACNLNIDRAHPTTPARRRAMRSSPEWWAPHWGKGASQGWAGMCAHGWVWLGDAHGWELEPGSAAAVMGQGLTALGAEMGLWALGRVGESPGKAGQVLVGPLGPDELWWDFNYQFVPCVLPPSPCVPLCHIPACHISRHHKYLILHGMAAC